MDAPGRERPTPLSFGRQLTARMVGSTKGVDAWSGLAITQTPDGRAHIAITAYFSDLNKLRFDMPIEFHWTFDETGATLSVERLRTAVNSTASLTEAEIRDLVAKTKAKYEGERLAYRTQLNAFRLSMTFVLPGELGNERLMARDANKVAFTLEGRKAADALDKFMADDAALAATFRRGTDSSENDDHMLASMYGKPGPVRVQSKFGVDDAPLFDYQAEMTAAGEKQEAMFKAAGVELMARFIVKDPATAPAGAPATTRGR